MMRTPLFDLYVLWTTVTHLCSGCNRRTINLRMSTMMMMYACCRSSSRGSLRSSAILAVPSVANWTWPRMRRALHQQQQPPPQHRAGDYDSAGGVAPTRLDRGLIATSGSSNSCRLTPVSVLPPRTQNTVLIAADQTIQPSLPSCVQR